MRMLCQQNTIPGKVGGAAKVMSAYCMCTLNRMFSSAKTKFAVSDLARLFAAQSYIVPTRIYL